MVRSEVRASALAEVADVNGRRQVDHVQAVVVGGGHPGCGREPLKQAGGPNRGARHEGLSQASLTAHPEKDGEKAHG